MLGELRRVPVDLGRGVAVEDVDVHDLVPADREDAVLAVGVEALARSDLGLDTFGRLVGAQVQTAALGTRGVDPELLPAVGALEERRGLVGAARRNGGRAREANLEPPGRRLAFLLDLVLFVLKANLAEPRAQRRDH
eukprot:9125595-Pyramimonas_sp.AAC.1